MRRDRDGRGGGIILLMNSDFPSSRKTYLETDFLENLVSVEVHINDSKWLIMGIYKPPLVSDNDFSDTLQEI